LGGSKRRRGIRHQPDGCIGTDVRDVIANDHQTAALRLGRARLADQSPFEQEAGIALDLHRTGIAPDRLTRHNFALATQWSSVDELRNVESPGRT
jgi:hypothetical protein